MCRKSTRPLSAVLASVLRDGRKKLAPAVAAGSPAPETSSLVPKSHNDGISADSIIALVSKSEFPAPKEPFAAVHHCRQERLTYRRPKHIFRNTQSRRFDRLVKVCAENIGAEAALQVFGKLGIETGVKEYNALIGICVEKARGSSSEDESLCQIQRALGLLRSMRERGFPLEEDTYGQLLRFLVDMGMEQEFYVVAKFIEDDSTGSVPRLGYYEMLLWIKLDDADKIHELCSSVEVDCDEEGLELAISYLSALCENDREKELLKLLEVVQIARISCLSLVEEIFKFLGRMLLESYMEELIFALKKTESGAEKVSVFICHYVTSILRLEVDEVVFRFKYLHKKLQVQLSSEASKMLIMYCCNLLKVHAALDVVDYICQSGLVLSADVLQPIVHASEQASDFSLVHPIYATMRRHGLTLKEEAIRSLINMCVKMKDFKGAYDILKNSEEMGLKPTATMYNALLAGYFRENNSDRALVVLEQMKQANVDPDSETYSYLLSNCDCEEDIDKIKEQLKSIHIYWSKQIYMALVNAYADCGLFEKAKQVLLDENIPVKNINEIRSALISALAFNGRIMDSIKMYKEVQQSECQIDSKTILSIIENIKSVGELNNMLELLGQLKGSCYWFEGCCRTVIYCVRHKHIRYAVNLLKQLKEKDERSTHALFDKIFNEVFNMEPVSLDIGLDLLQAMKKDLMLQPCRTSLDFLLSTCVSARDPHCARLIWEEYEKACLPYNILTYLRMYQVMLATGEQKSASEMLRRIKKDDPHIRCIIKACKETFGKPSSANDKKSAKIDVNYRCD